MDESVRWKSVCVCVCVFLEGGGGKFTPTFCPIACRITEDAGSFFKELFTPRSDNSKKRHSPEKKLRIGFRPMSSFRGKPENSDGTDSSSVSDIDDDFVAISKWVDGGEYGGKTREIRRKRIIANRVSDHLVLSLSFATCLTSSGLSPYL